MTEALTEVAVWALHQPSVFRIGAVCDVENNGSARVLEKSGFVREELLRRWLVHPAISNAQSATPMTVFFMTNLRRKC